MDKVLADAIRAIDSNTSQRSKAAKRRKRIAVGRRNGGKPKGSGNPKPPTRKPDETQIRVAINVRPVDWNRFRANAAEDNSGIRMTAAKAQSPGAINGVPPGRYPGP